MKFVLSQFPSSQKIHTEALYWIYAETQYMVFQVNVLYLNDNTPEEDFYDLNLDSPIIQSNEFSLGIYNWKVIYFALSVGK